MTFQESSKFNHAKPFDFDKLYFNMMNIFIDITFLRNGLVTDKKYANFLHICCNIGLIKYKIYSCSPINCSSAIITSLSHSL